MIASCAHEPTWFLVLLAPVFLCLGAAVFLMALTMWKEYRNAS